jgi:proteasome accessory factor B
VSAARAERLVNLVLCLLGSRRYLTAEQLREIVPGYTGGSEEAFLRTFERDKAELRDLGVPIEVGRNSITDLVDGYRIARDDYELDDVRLEPDEAAAVALAVRLWDSPELTGAATGALHKLRAAGIDVDEEALPRVEPRVAAAEPAFEPLLAAVRADAAVRFCYRRSGDSQAGTRTLDPWGVVSWRGRWYVVGHDRDRDAPRCFRLSRIVGAPAPFGQAVVLRPPGIDLMAYVAASAEPQEPATAELWVAWQRASGLRRRGTVVGPRELAGRPGELIRIELAHPEKAAGWIAGFGADAVVLSPEVLAKAVAERLRGALAGGAGGPG